MDDQTTPTGSPLLRWAAGEPQWIKHVARDVLDGTTTPTNLRLDHYIDLFQRESGFSSDPMLPPPELAEPTLPATNPGTERLALDSLEITGGVNQLKPGTKLEFGTALTVVYGENGCGKSGFVRVLKRASGARTNTPILGDIRKESDQEPSAQFKYITVAPGSGKSEKPTPVSLAWKNELALDPLTSVAVFDTPASAVHVDDDLAYTYTPGSLSYYGVIRDALEGIKGKLAEQAAVPLDPAVYQKHFVPSGPVSIHVASVGANTNVTKLRELASITQDDEKRIPEIVAELAALRASSPEAELHVSESRLRVLDRAISVLGTGRTLDATAYESRLAALKEATDQEVQATTAAFENVSVPGIHSVEWRAFIEAGYAFEKSLEPHGNDSSLTCAYCQQQLEGPARELLAKYRDFCSGVARQKRQAAEAALTEVTSPIVSLAVEEVIAAVNTELPAGTELNWNDLVAGLRKISGDRNRILAQGGFEGADNRTGVLDAASTQAETERLRLTGLVSSLRSAKDDRTARISKLEAEVLALKERVILRDLLPAIEKQVADAKRVAQLQGAVRSIAVSQRQLTEASTEHSNSLVNQNFEKQFSAECKNLQAPTTISLEFPGREGRSKRKKVIARGIKPSDVLSEGEQKAVAMADFIAEASLSGANGPLVFDDPVNSLDYRRLDTVTKVLHRLARERQVIVFTHNVWFASALLDVKGTLKAGTRYWDVSRTEQETGIVTPASHPQIDSYASLKKRLNVAIEDAKKQTGDEQRESIKKGYGLLRSMTEVVAEKDLFKGVSQRYQAHVAMTQLSEVSVENLQEGIDQLYPVYEQACRFIDGHSQPLEQSNIQPTLESLQKHFAIVENVHSAHT